MSSEQQAEAGTIESQVAALRERIAQDGQQVAEERVFLDDGYSGSTLVRPALEQLRDQVAVEGLDRLYVLAPDRLARRYAYQVLLVEEFQRTGVEVVFLNRELGDNPEDDLLLQVQGIVAEYERAKILERSRRGKRHRARSGSQAVLSGAPYGYCYVTKAEGGGQARYEVIPSEARVVRQVFAWVGLERLSIGEVCRRLTQTGIPTRTGKTTWDRSVVWGMLKNPAYRGQAAFGKTQSGPLRPRLRPQRGAALQPRRPVSTSGVPAEEWIHIPVPALVEESLFEAVQSQLQENRQRARQGQRGAHYLLQGLLVCQQCGYALYGKPVSRSAAKGKTRRYAYYRCIGTDAYRFGGERVCDTHQVRTDLLDQAVWHEVVDLLTTHQRLEQEYSRRLNASRAQPDELTAIQTQMARTQQGLERLIDGYAEGYIQKDEFMPRMTRLRQRLAELDAQAQQLRDELSLQQELRLVISRLEDFADVVRDQLDQVDWATQRDLIRALVKRVEVGQAQVNVVFRVPSALLQLYPDIGSLQDCWRGHHAPLRGALLCWKKFAFLHHACLEPGSNSMTDGRKGIELFQ